MKIIMIHLQLLRYFLMQNSYKTQENKAYTSKIDSFLFGNILYSILFGNSPASFIEQLKDWCDCQTNFNFNEILFPKNIVSKNFNYYPFKNAFNKNEESPLKNLIDSMKIKSFSAIIPKAHLNDKESSKTLNGIGLIFDLINSCLSVDEKDRPTLSDLMDSELFQIQNFEKQLIKKFAKNTLKYFSPEMIMLKQILIPLREVIKCINLRLVAR